MDLLKYTECPILNDDLKYLEKYRKYGKMFQTKIVNNDPKGNIMVKLIFKNPIFLKNIKIMAIFFKWNCIFFYII